MNERPPVVIPQLLVRYHHFHRTNPRIRPIATADYVNLLYRSIDFTYAKHAQFCVYPEYSWPLPEAHRVFRELNDRRQEGRAFLLSFEHMSVTEYETLLEDLASKDFVERRVVDDERRELEELNSAQDKDHGIVNVCFIVLQTDASLIVVPQRKLRPAALEENIHDQWAFVPGTTVRQIESHDGCRFAALICFDFINRREETPDRPRDVIARQRFNYLFVPECNPQPLHDFYFKGAIAMFQAARWAQHHPVIIMANVAGGSDVPALREWNPTFGFSRLIGRLGRVHAQSEGLYVFSGFVTHDAPRRLSDIERPVEDHNVSTLVIRPEQSVALISLPSMVTGPARNPSVKRFDTSVKIYRPVGSEPALWRVIAPLPDPPRPPEEMDIPENAIVRDHDGLIGVEPLVESLMNLVSERATPINIAGPGGSGKSALVATVLSTWSGEDRVLWIDIPSVEEGFEPLLEALLRKLGRGDAVALDIERKSKVLREELSRKPTIIVLDGAERAADVTIVRTLENLQSWKTLVIVISQLDDPKKGDADVFVGPLNIDNFRALILRTSHLNEKDLPRFFVDRTHGVTGGAALGAVWAGQLLRSAPHRASSLADALKDVPPDEGLQALYKWCWEESKPLDRTILGILCELPAPVPIEDLGSVVGASRNAIRQAVSDLHGRGLLIHDRSRPSPPQQPDKLHFRHPFVQRFWSRGQGNDESWRLAVDWAKSVAEEYGHDKATFPQLADRWLNVGFVLRKLARHTPAKGKPAKRKFAKADEDVSKRSFLNIWERIDTFLWITARWRERINLGTEAVTIAADLSRIDQSTDLRLQSRALFDSLGKTIWHRDPSSKEAEEFLSWGYRVAAATGDEAMRARYHWYKSRLHLFRDEKREAKEEAELAQERAEDVHDLELSAVIENALGNVQREMGGYPQASAHYETASRLIDGVDTESATELRDIIVRNRGRLELELGNYTAAITLLEDAMERFGRADNIAQQAECAVYHARALVRIEETAEAERELDWAEKVAAAIGSAVVRTQIEKSRREIEELKQRV